MVCWALGCASKKSRDALHLVFFLSAARLFSRLGSSRSTSVVEETNLQLASERPVLKTGTIGDLEPAPCVRVCRSPSSTLPLRPCATTGASASSTRCPGGSRRRWRTSRASPARRQRARPTRSSWGAIPGTPSHPNISPCLEE
uniref:Putative secreted protein n=1 Tax=Ixodes scapularis TaxID=6945 RepID=A0A4D5RDN5_IXOSC